MLRVLCTRSAVDGVNRDILVAAEWRLDARPIGKSLDAAGGRVQTLEEDKSRVLQNCVHGGRDGELGEDGRVCAEALDPPGRVGINIAVVVENT